MSQLNDFCQDLIMKFAAIDFETSNESRSSACAIGAVLFEVDDDTKVWNFNESSVFYELIRPPNNSYSRMNSSIHGITAEMTADTEPFSHVWSRLEELLDGHILVAHNAAFDISVLRASADACQFSLKPYDFVCTYRLAKASFPNLFSYRLDVLADQFGIELHHHHAGWDAYAASQVAVKICEANNVYDLVSAAERLGFQLGRFESATYRSFSNADQGKASLLRFKDLVPTGDVDESHPMYGRTFAFTGSLTAMTRNEAAQLVINCGGEAHAGPTRSTDYLVVGITDFSRVRDGMSGKMKKALELAESGCGIEIIDEGAFLKMLV